MIPSSYIIDWLSAKRQSGMVSENPGIDNVTTMAYNDGEWWRKGEMHPVQATKYTTYACVERNGCKSMIGYYGIRTRKQQDQPDTRLPTYGVTWSTSRLVSSTVVWWFSGKKNNFCLCAHYYALHCIYISIIAVLSLLPVTDALEGVVRLHYCLLHAPYILLYPVCIRVHKWAAKGEIWLNDWMNECTNAGYVLRWIYIRYDYNW